jgi:hypothetical protein
VFSLVGQYWNRLKAVAKGVETGGDPLNTDLLFAGILSV